MVKAASPVRLQQDLMQSAKLTGERFHRSTAEQVEYWADIGRRISDVIDPDVLISIKAGLSQLKVEPTIGKPVNPTKVFEMMEIDRNNGLLEKQVTSSPFQYQTSLVHPGCLERINENGSKTIGHFKQGQFIELKSSDR
jgi:hypothetical protein